MSKVYWYLSHADIFSVVCSTLWCNYYFLHFFPLSQSPVVVGELSGCLLFHEDSIDRPPLLFVFTLIYWSGRPPKVWEHSSCEDVSWAWEVDVGGTRWDFSGRYQNEMTLSTAGSVALLQGSSTLADIYHQLYSFPNNFVLLCYSNKSCLQSSSHTSNLVFHCWLEQANYYTTINRESVSALSMSNR